MERVSVQLKARRRSVTVDGRSTMLQEKNWQVLSMLKARAPEIVNRADIINTVWQGNFLTGEKGLNQAVWAIRSALADDPRDPRFIRTVPRLGYQWIHPGISTRERDASLPMRRIVSMAAGVAALLVVPAATTYLSMGAPTAPAEPPGISRDMVATNAYLVDRDIHVEFANGCRGILKNQSYAEIGTPVLSSDGAQVAVTIRKDKSCHLVTIDVSNGERQEFGACPSDVI